MNYRMFNKLNWLVAFKGALAIFLAVMLAACGGGAKDTTSSTSGSLSLSLVDGSGNAVTNAVVGGAYTLVATVSPVNTSSPNIVTFTAGGNASLNPSSGTALVNAAGVATVGFIPTTAGASTAGASATVQITKTTAATSTTSASTTTSNVTVAGSLNYQVSAATPTTITLSALTVTTPTLVSGGNTSIGAYVYSNGVLATTTPTPVSFTASCGQVTPNIITSDGNAHVTTNYSAIDSLGNLCTGSVIVTAAAARVSQQASLTVSAPVTGSLTFVPPATTTTVLFLSGSGGSSQSNIQFVAKSSVGTALGNWPIDVTLIGNPGGVTFGTQGNTAALLLYTDSAGVLNVPIYAGGTPGPVTVKAAWQNNPQIYATSNQVTVASGPTQQKRMSLSVSTFSIDAYEIDGKTTTITARVADANGNPVPDGTVVNFVAAGGQIQRQCTTSGANAGGFSQCSILLMGQNPRVTTNPTLGRIAVLAYLEGVKNYVDNNNNNQYDAGIDTLIDQGDAYRDDNESGAYDNGEFVIAKGGSGVCPASVAGTPSRAGTCTGLLPTTVRAQTTVLFASGQLLITPDYARMGSFTTTAPANYYFSLNGANTPLLPMPAGTTMKVSITNPPANGCTVGAPTGFPLADVPPTPNPLDNLGTYHSVLLTPPVSGGPPTCKGQTIRFDATSPGGTLSHIELTIP
jgi:hypothetical protein